MRETLLFILDGRLPFGEMDAEMIDEINNSIQYHFRRALKAYHEHLEQIELAKDRSSGVPSLNELGPTKKNRKKSTDSNALNKSKSDELG
mmetsp:Transcript_2760/g.2402  ORF Transcript_2760/g.2402 Transcript_2760/m.2402 type:complete len:90 (-) Transcript_2760:78-347(-)